MPGLNQPVDVLAARRKVVLLVDDQAIIAEAVRRMIEGEDDIELHYCSDPAEALDVAARVEPNVILQDLVMPQIAGLTLVRYFRAHPSTKEVPLIVLSSKEDPAIKAEAFALGANDYMVKLPDRLELLARIRYHAQGYINLLQRNEAFAALEESRQQLEVRNRFIRETFGRYLSDEIVSSLLETNEGLKLGGEKRKVTIMMTDLRGFTRIAEGLAPEKVVLLINNFLEAMTEVIVQYQGTIDEFIGDAILVLFGAPIARDDDARRAVQCAVAMQLAMTAVNEKNAHDGLPAVEMGIGINTGEVVVGNIGSHKRAKYGAVGTTVNVTSRIESLTLGGQILVAASTHAEVAPYAEIEGTIEASMKGVAEPIPIYEVRGIDGARLPLRASELVDLPSPVPVTLSILEGKHFSSASVPGTITRCSRLDAEILAPSPAPLTNVKLQIAGVGDVYAKVTRGVGTERFQVRFTSVPEGFAGF
jgi:adenylate cyclase